MRFASNQVLEISGCLSLSGELEAALEFALKYSGEDKNMLQSEIDRGCKLVYQITNDGRYCIGWGFESIPSGWSEYPFKFDIASVSKIIQQHLENYPVKEDIWTGAYEKGFIMKCIDESLVSENDGIKTCIRYCLFQTVYMFLFQVITKEESSFELSSLVFLLV